jgi:hypothetical protein
MSQEVIAHDPVEVLERSALRRRVMGGAAATVLLAAAGVGTVEYLQSKQAPACYTSYAFDDPESPGGQYFITPDGRPGRVAIFDQPDLSIRVGVAPASQLNEWTGKQYKDSPNVSFARPIEGETTNMSFALGHNWDFVVHINHEAITAQCVEHPTAAP